jgi:hypothetical protein
MAHLLIQMDRGDGAGWRVRAEGEVDVTPEQVAASLPSYAVTYRHRAYLNGELIATAEPRRATRQPAAVPSMNT